MECKRVVWGDTIYSVPIQDIQDPSILPRSSKSEFWNSSITSMCIWIGLGPPNPLLVSYCQLDKKDFTSTNKKIPNFFPSNLPKQNLKSRSFTKGSWPHIFCMGDYKPGLHITQIQCAINLNIEIQLRETLSLGKKKVHSSSVKQWINLISDC